MSGHVFDKLYAGAYDALYQDKDYEAECDFLQRIFHRYAQSPIRTILDLGCGTGSHALLLAQRGYVVTGVDRSEEMLRIARSKVTEPALVRGQQSVVFHQGDIRTLDLGRTFDAVIAMFAVISYQTTNEDLMAAFRTARQHLNRGGLFVFDAWFGPAVLTERPSDRCKIVERDGERIIRFAHPELDVVAQTVRVNYKVLHLKEGHMPHEMDEAHTMRFLFAQELVHFLELNGLEMLNLCPFMELDRRITGRDWNMIVVAQSDSAHTERGYR